MTPLFAAVTAMVVSLTLIPLMIRLAPRLHLLDQPNARKVHVEPIPRVGGWGISVGALAAILLWSPLDSLSGAFVFGSLVLTIGGAADDMRELPGNLKLLIQFLAVVPVVLFTGLAVDVVPFVSDIHLPHALAVIVTVAGLTVCINATNTSDGLDGLAAGATLLSLFGLLYVAYTSGADQIMLMTAAALGGLVGFLRYNTHPAKIFMGDLGSQFLGFSVGFLGIALLHSDPDAFSPYALLLVLGLPIADIAVVAIQRLIARTSLFRADKSHIHHRFLDLGLSHAQSVVVFYTLQGSFVFFGVALRESDPWAILLVYAIHIAGIYGLLFFAERSIGTIKVPAPDDTVATTTSVLPQKAVLSVPRVTLEILVPLVLIAGAVLATRIPVDFGILGALLLLVLVARLFSPRLQGTSATRIVVFLLATAVVYLFTNYRPFDSTLAWLTEVLLIVTMAIMAFIAVKFSPKRRKEEFRTNATDHLVAVFAILAIIALRTIPSMFNPYFLFYLPVVLYSCELLVIERRQRTNWLPPATLVAAAILAIRGL